MASSNSQGEGGVGMADVLKALGAIQEGQRRLATEVESVSQRLDSLAPSAQDPTSYIVGKTTVPASDITTKSSDIDRERPGTATGSVAEPTSPTTTAALQAQQAGFTSRIVLT